MSSMVLAIMFAPVAFADTTTPEAETGTTYTEQFIQKHTQKVIDAEKKLQELQQASEDAAAANQKANQEAWEQKKQEIQLQQQDFQNALEQKKQEFMKQQEERQNAWEPCSPEPGRA